MNEKKNKLFSYVSSMIHGALKQTRLVIQRTDCLFWKREIYFSAVLFLFCTEVFSLPFDSF